MNMPTVLVVDDQPAVRTMIALLLEQEGFAVMTAEGGRQAISIARTHPGGIDLLVSDVTMPEMDGPTLARHLVAENTGLSVLLISGCCDAEQLQNCSPFSLLPKPLQLSSFLAAVENLTSKSTLERKAEACRGGASGRTMTLVLFGLCLLSATAVDRVLAACGPCVSTLADSETSQAPGSAPGGSKEALPSADVEDAQPAPAQTAEQTDGAAQQQQTKPSDAKKAEKRGEWVLAPIPINSPAIGGGLEWAVARVFPLNKKDEVSPPSTVGLGGVFTNNGSRAVAAGGRLYLKEDKYRLFTAFGTANVNLDIYGVGQSAGDNGTFVPLNTEGKGFLGEALYGIRKNIYIGLRGQYRNLRLSLDREKLGSSEITSQTPEQVAGVIDQIGEELTQQQTVSLGPRFQWDTRDDLFYPKRGIFLDLNLDFFGQGIGSKFTYQYYKFGFNKYTKLGDHQILAFRVMGCAAVGDRIPIYDLCLFGAANDLRGYSAGRYQDRRMFATQAEYRFTVPARGFLGRFGMVAFGGFGGVGKNVSDIGSDLLPAGGGGARFRLTKKNPINFRVDYAIGKVGHTLIIGVLEAF